MLSSSSAVRVRGVLFIYGMCNDAISSSDCETLDYTMINHFNSKISLNFVHHILVRITVCSQINTKHINTQCGQRVQLLNVKLAVHKVNVRSFKISE